MSELEHDKQPSTPQPIEHTGIFVEADKKKLEAIVVDRLKAL